MNGELVSKFAKNARDEFRVLLTKFQGQNLIDMRVWTADKGGGDHIPTKKGVSLSIRHFASLKKAVEDLEKALIEKKIIK